MAPALQTIVRSSDNLLARFHALWTLEGLGVLDAALTREMLRDPNPRMRIQAMRASETLYKAGDRSFAEDYRALANDADTDVAIQAMLTMNILKVPDTPTLVKGLMERNKVRGVQFVGERILAAAAAVERAAGAQRVAHAGTAEQSRARRDHLHRALFHLPRSGWARDTDAWRGGLDTRAVARGIAACECPPRLRDQIRHARALGSDRREDVPAGHGANGLEQRSMDRRRGVVRAQQFWKQRCARHNG